MNILSINDLYQAIDQFGTEVVIAHLNHQASATTCLLLADHLDCLANGGSIVHTAVERMQQRDAQRYAGAKADVAAAQRFSDALERTKQTKAEPTPAPSKAPARKWNGSKWIRADKRLAIYLRDGFCCGYCGKNLATVRAKLRTLDHVTPVVLGGTNEASNLLTCCKRCNDRKQDKPAVSWCSDDVFRRICAQVYRPLNRELAKQILAGTLDLSDCIEE